MTAPYAPFLPAVAIAWSALAVAPGLSEPVKLCGLLLVAAALVGSVRIDVFSQTTNRVFTGYLVSLLIATLLAREPAIALSGTVGRAQGLLASLGLVIVVAAAANLDERWRTRTIVVTVLVGLLVGSMALLQRAGLDPLGWTAAIPARPAATLSNASVLAGFLGLCLLLALWLSWSRPRARSRWLIAAGVLFAGLLASGNRSMPIALALTGLMLALLQARWRAWRLPVLALVVLLTGALASQRIESLHDRSVLWRAAAHTIGTPPRVVDLSGQADALQRWRPWIGYGPDQQQAPLRLQLSGLRPDAAVMQADRAHQLLLDRVLESGWLGLAAGLALCLLVAARLWPRLWQAPSADRTEAVALACALGAWLLHLQMNFALTGDRTLAFVLIGFALAPPGARMASSARGWPLLHASAMLVLLAGAAFALLGPAVQAERIFVAGQQRYAQALTAEPVPAARQLTDAARLFEQVAALRRFDTDAALAAASAWIEAAAISGEQANIDAARQWLARARAVDPRDPRLQPVEERIARVQAALGP